MGEWKKRAESALFAGSVRLRPCMHTSASAHLFCEHADDNRVRKSDGQRVLMSVFVAWSVRAQLLDDRVLLGDVTVPYRD